MRLARDNGCPVDHNVMPLAAKGGHVECLRFARDNGASWGSFNMFNAASFAANAGKLDCLRYALENGCPAYGGMCNVATRSGSAECLRYLHERGFAIYASTALTAAEIRRLECYMYIRQNGPSPDMITRALALRNGWPETRD